MPKRSDIKSVLIIGSGPITIGQACEFDYAGTQACIALKEEGYRVILVNSNPATIMTDPKFADATYIEPLSTDVISAIIEKERPDAILSTMGGQTSLNLSLELVEKGILDKYNIELIGAEIDAIKCAENRELFRQKIVECGLEHPKSRLVRNSEEAVLAAEDIGYPIMVRSSYALGGKGSGIVANKQDLLDLCHSFFRKQPKEELFLDEALIGWKEFEMEVVRDKQDNCIIVCSIENFDPLGIHTGDSVTVAPAQTLTDKEYQKMRDASFKVLRAIGVETGGANVQFAVDPKTGRIVVIEMNPRVSRSSALASKATGFPIAKVAAKLAVGYTLDELENDITKNSIPASFEPVLDYVVVKIPCFQFEKYPGSQDLLSTEMHSIGETMAIGRTFQEALLKCMRSLPEPSIGKFEKAFLSNPNSKRLWYLFEAFRSGMSRKEIHVLTNIDYWFLEEIQDLVESEKTYDLTSKKFLELKRKGFSDKHLSNVFRISEEEVRQLCEKWGIRPVVKHVDSCSGEYFTPCSYLYTTYEQFCEFESSSKPKVMIIGSGANSVGQGIEFDYCCVHAVDALKELSYETVMVNCNPETVSTDYNFADRLYFSPLTIGDLLPIILKEKPLGVLIQFGGQIPLNLSKELEKNGIIILGINSKLIEICENRNAFRDFICSLKLDYPESFTIKDLETFPPALEFPVIIRPSYVLSGNKMVIVNNFKELKNYANKYPDALNGNLLVVERFLKDAVEIDVDAISDGERVFIPAIMEQLEPTGIHSGDSTSCIPPITISKEIQDKIIEITLLITIELKIKGPINIQFAILNNRVYVLEVNPRASRTIPFVSKAMGIDFVKIAIKCIMGFSLNEHDCLLNNSLGYFYVKQPFFPKAKFPKIPLGPEMKSTGEAMGIGKTFDIAYAKALAATHTLLLPMDSFEVEPLQEIYKHRKIKSKKWRRSDVEKISR